MKAYYFFKGLAKWLVIVALFAFAGAVATAGCATMGNNNIPINTLAFCFIGGYIFFFGIGLIPALSIFIGDIKRHGVEIASEGKMF